MKIIKNNYKFILGLLIGSLFSGFGVYAATYAIHSNNVQYTDNYGLGATNVQNAIDNNVSKISNLQTQLNGISTDLGNIQIVGVKSARVDIPSSTTNTQAFSTNFGSISGATNYIVIPNSLLWHVPYNLSVSGTTLSFNVLRLDTTGHTGYISFYVIGYKSV